MVKANDDVTIPKEELGAVSCTIQQTKQRIKKKISIHIIKIGKCFLHESNRTAENIDGIEMTM